MTDKHKCLKHFWFLTLKERWVTIQVNNQENNNLAVLLVVSFHEIFPWHRPLCTNTLSGGACRGWGARCDEWCREGAAGGHGGRLTTWWRSRWSKWHCGTGGLSAGTWNGGSRWGGHWQSSRQWHWQMSAIQSFRDQGTRNLKMSNIHSDAKKHMLNENTVHYSK